MARTQECILYRDFENGEILDTMTSLMNSYEAKEEGFENRKEEFGRKPGGDGWNVRIFRESVAQLPDTASGKPRKRIQHRF